MEKKLLKKDKLSGIVKKMAADKTVFAPVQDEDNVLFKVLEPGMEPLVAFANTKNAPKKVFFPHSELLLKYTRSPKGMVFAAMPADVKEFVLFGVRALRCPEFLPFWTCSLTRRSGRTPTTSKSVKKARSFHSPACSRPTRRASAPPWTEAPPRHRGPTFCLPTWEKATSWSSSLPRERASRPISARRRPPTPAPRRRRRRSPRNRLQAIQSKIPGRAIKPILDVSFEHPFWDTIYGKCLACGTCTYLCPTCHCFDISDEVKRDDGIRIRNWDSCMFPLFTKETSGHNPRSSQKERWRQRVMHKFKYYVDNFDAIACVGCGRCVMSCPVNIDIRKIVEDISKL